MYMNPLSWIDDELRALDRQHLRRQLRTRGTPQSARLIIDGRELVNFGSNDYLALAADPRLAAAVTEAVRREGWGSGASPLVTGHAALHRQLEERLAEFEGSEAALLFSSGFAANAGTIAALAGPGDVVYCDRKNHASLWDGCRLSRADVRTYPHNDCGQLAKLLGGAGKYRRRLIVTDGLFSMDGDLAPLGELAELAAQHEAMLMVDEAHATGVFGRHGRGVAEHLGVEDGVHVRIGTLSKALGGVGGFVAGGGALVEWLVNRARPYVFSTAPPAAIAAAALAALDIVRDEPDRRKTLLTRAESLRAELARQGWNAGASASQIIPIIVGDAQRAVSLSQQLLARGLFVPAIRPPTVPDGEACLRISLTAGHTEEMISALLEHVCRLVPSPLGRGLG
jgi:8-amino-7-oxononanoate synthase